jgi:thymidylate synthase (FAD)
MDELLRVELISQTPRPQSNMWAAMHQDYSEGFVSDERLFDRDNLIAQGYTDAQAAALLGTHEAECGELVVKHLLAGGRGHYGPLEHPQIVLNVGWFPHSCMQQVRTHRVGISFDCQSFRYSGQRIKALGDYCFGAFNSFASLEDAMPGLQSAIEEVFYLRPIGRYTNRQGKKYEYTEEQRVEDLVMCGEAAIHYAHRIDQGFAEEHARSMIPFDVRQHWVMSVNVRSLMHLLDLRAKADAQLECQQLCELIWPHFEAWVPAIAEWYRKERWAKARLAP